MELWDIYDADKKPTGRTMKRNDWCLKDGEYHLTVLGVVARPDQTFLITKRVMTKAAFLLTLLHAGLLCNQSKTYCPKRNAVHRPITQSSSHQASAVHPENTGVNNINNECSFLQFCLC